MNRLNGLGQAVSLAALILIVVPALAAPTSAVGDMDIGALMARAEETLDLGATDAVVLFDGRTVRVASDGAVQTTFHQIVWISTELGIEEYAVITSYSIHYTKLYDGETPRDRPLRLPPGDVA